jgi:hypothetical protein
LDIWLAKHAHLDSWTLFCRRMTTGAGSLIIGCWFSGSSFFNNDGEIWSTAPEIGARTTRNELLCRFNLVLRFKSRAFLVPCSGKSCGIESIRSSGEIGFCKSE